MLAIEAILAPVSEDPSKFTKVTPACDGFLILILDDTCLAIILIKDSLHSTGYVLFNFMV